MSNIKISVVIPVYNVAALLPRCLDSILDQSVKELEIICINDCSPDNSGEVIDDYAARFPNIKAIHNRRNSGPMIAREKGYTTAVGEYLFFCDGDDFLPKDALEILYSAAKESDADIIVGNAETVNSKGRHTLRNRAGTLDNNWQTYLRSILNWGTPALWGSLYKKSLFRDIKYTAEDMRFSEDRLLLTEMLILKHPVIKPVNSTTYYYWANQNSTTRKKMTDDAVRQQFKALYRSYDLVNDKTPEFSRDNDNQMLRYLSLYLERGVKADNLRNLNDTSARLLKFNNMRNIVGLRMAFHTYLSMNVPGYSNLMFSIRCMIRKLQGK